MDERQVVYILDDEPANIDVLVETLREDYIIAAGTDAKQALLDIARLKPDLLLLDVLMPVLDGFELCRRIKADQGVKDIPVIFITAKNEVEDEMLGFELGAVDFISKPISPPLVRARVRTHIDLLLSRRKMRQLSDKLSRYLSPQIYQSIFEGRRDVQLETTRKKLTIFFSDIVGFTTSSEQMEPEDLNYILNGYLERMSRIVLEYGGVLDKFIGDAILVFFGDPESKGPQLDAVNCIRMALAMQAAIRDLRAEWSREGIEIPFSVRMGVASGYTTVGNFGCSDRMDYTVIGAQVNLASRLESEAQPGTIMISQDTWSLIKDQVYCEKKGEITIRGFARPFPVFQVIDLHENRNQDGDSFRLESEGFSLMMDAKKIPEEEKRRLFNQLQLAIAYLNE
jgi:class 3 adenylate cyclase